jgi:hypothetical protein
MAYVDFHYAPTNPTKGLSRFLQSVFQKLVRRYRIRRQRCIDRQAFTTLLYLDEAILHDMGYTLEEVVSAQKLPQEINAARYLRDQRRLRRTNAHHR